MSKAVVFKELGDSDVLQVIDDYELPPKQEGEVKHALHVLVPLRSSCEQRICTAILDLICIENSEVDLEIATIHCRSKSGCIRPV